MVSVLCKACSLKLNNEECELKVAILKKAARIENNITTKRVKEFDRDLTANKDN